ncbi:MAG: Thiol-disulfide oxidoreductase ResA [Saprospiraceae bacterium]|nr:Thiol-disulfide oxidoreductase ResA [Saprospiraceae bacterium]
MPASRLLPYLILSALVLSSSRCQTQPPPVLSGRIALHPGWRPVLYLLQPRNFGDIATNYAGAVVDSAVIKPDGSFSFDRFHAPELPALYELVIQPEGSRFANKLNDEDPETANYLSVVLKKGEEVRLQAEAGHFSATATIEPYSADNHALIQLRDIRRLAFDRFMRTPEGGAHADDTALLEQAERIGQYRAPLLAFADTTKSYRAALLAIRWVSPESDYERVPEFLHRQCERWQAIHPDHPFVQQLCQLSAPGRLPLMVGNTIPDFPLPLSGGDTLNLYTLLGKRLTLLDLWASWCAPCRRENREVLAPLWAKYREQGFAIAGYALDSSPEAWKAAIQKDHALWPQASHLSGDSSPFLDTLHVTTIPANFLLDEQGKIVAKNLHGEKLMKFVEVYLSKQGN